MPTEPPSITVVEPVYPTADSETSRWVRCNVVWDAARGVFLNHEHDPEWVLDDHAFSDSVYIVDDEEYSNMDDAMRAALGDDRYDQHDPRIVFAPEEGHTPEWGPEA